MVVEMGSTSVGRICMDNLDPHNMNKLSCTHQNPQETHVNASMLPEVDWRAHDTHTSRCMLSEVGWGAHEAHTSGCVLSEVDCGAHDSSHFLYQECIEHDGEPKDIFTPGLWENYPKDNFPPLSWST